MDNQPTPPPSSIPQSGVPVSTLPPARPRSRKKIAIILGIIGLVLAVGAILFFILSRKALSPLDRVQLSNEKTISLGQSVDSLKGTLGSDLEYNPSIPDFYRFPIFNAEKRQREEVLIYTAEEKVVGIRIIKNEAHKQSESGIGVGTPINDVVQRYGDSLTKFEQFEPVKMSGYSYDNSKKTRSFYFTNPCSTNTNLISVAIVYIEHESTVINSGSGCNVFSS